MDAKQAAEIIDRVLNTYCGPMSATGHGLEIRDSLHRVRDWLDQVTDVIVVFPIGGSDGA